jgi:hypothetical protein
MGEVQINRFGGDRVGMVLKTKKNSQVYKIFFSPPDD